MAWNDAEETIVFGNGQAYFAPVGTTLPAKNTDPTAALNAAFTGLGYWTEDGATFTFNRDIANFRAAQARAAIRRELNGFEALVALPLMQWNESTLVFALGGSISTAGGFPTYTPPTPGDPIDECSLVVDIQDGERNFRWVYPRGGSTENVESQFHREDPALLPVTFGALEPAGGGDPFYWITDDTAAFATGS